MFYLRFAGASKVIPDEAFHSSKHTAHFHVSLFPVAESAGFVSVSSGMITCYVYV